MGSILSIGYSVAKNTMINPIVKMWADDVKKMNRQYNRMVKEAEERVKIESDLLRVRNEVTWHETW